MFYIILILCNSRSWQFNYSQIFINKGKQAAFPCKELRQTLNVAWLMVMTRYDMEDTRGSPAKWYGNWVSLLLGNGQMLGAGVNNSFLHHSFSFRRMWKPCHCSYALPSPWRVRICILHKSPHSHSAGASSCSASSVFNMLFMYLSPKWVYDNSLLQRSLSKDRKRKNDRVSYSWEQEL